MYAKFKGSFKPAAALLAVLILAAFTLAGCGGSKGASNYTVKIGYVHLLDAGPAMIEQQQGLMKKQGMNTKYYSFKNGPALYKALSSGKLDLAFAGVPPAVNWSSRGAKFKIIAKVTTGKFGLLAKPGGVTKPSDLKGKKIGTVVKGSGVDILERGFLLPEAGLTPKDVTMVQMGMSNMEPAIKNGTIDAAVAGEPFLTMAELRGLKVVKELPDPAFVVLATDGFLKNHAQDVKKFIKGHEEAIAFIQNKPDQAAKIFADSFKVPQIKAGGKTYSPQEIMAKALVRNKYAAKITGADVKFYQQIADADYKLKLIDKPMDISKIIDRSWTK